MSEFPLPLHRNNLIIIEFTDPLIRGLFCRGTPKSQRFPCSKRHTTDFYVVLGEILAAKSIEDLFVILHLDTKFVDRHSSSLSLKVNSTYRIEIICKEDSGSLKKVIIEKITQNISGRS